MYCLLKILIKECKRISSLLSNKELRAGTGWNLRYTNDLIKLDLNCIMEDASSSLPREI